MSDRELLLQLLGGLCLCENMGDVADDVRKVLERLVIEDAYDEVYDDWQRSIARTLHERGVTSLYGTELYGPDDDEDQES